MDGKEDMTCCENCIKPAVARLTELNEEGEIVGWCKECARCRGGERCQNIVEFRVEWTVVGGGALYLDACGEHAHPQKCCAKSNDLQRRIPYVQLKSTL